MVEVLMFMGMPVFSFLGRGIGADLSWTGIMRFLTDPRTTVLLVAIVLFLIALLVNLVQRRHARDRVDRLLRNEDNALNFLAGLHTSLGKLESACTLEMEGKSSPPQIAKSIRVARNQIQSTMADLVKNLRSFPEYRRKEKTRERQRKHLEKLRKKRLGK